MDADLLRAAESQARQAQPLISVVMTPQGPAVAHAMPLDQAIQLMAQMLEVMRMRYMQNCVRGSSAIEVVGADAAPQAERS